MNHQALSQEAFAHSRNGRFEEAMPLFERLVREHAYVSDDTYDGWMRALASCYDKAGRTTEAGIAYTWLRQYERAQDRFENAGDTLDLALLAERRGHTHEAAQLHRQSDRHGLAASAQARHLSTEPDAGLLILDHQRMTRSNPDNLKLRALADLHLGRSLMRAGLVEVARKILDRTRNTALAFAEGRLEAGRTLEAAFALRLVTLASELLEDPRGTAEGYARLAALHISQGQLYAALRFRETLAVSALDRQDYESAADIYQHTLNRCAIDRPDVVSTLQWRLAKAHVQAARTTTDAARATAAWSSAAHLFKKLGDATMLARCYREVAALQSDPQTRDHFWERARDVRGDVPATQAPLGDAPEPAKLTDWLDFSMTLLRVEDLRGDLGHLLRELVWSPKYLGMARKIALSILLDLIGRRQPVEDIFVRAAKMAPSLAAEAGIPLLEELMESHSEKVHVEIATSLGQMGPEGITALKHGLNDKRMAVRCAAIEAVMQHDYPEALAGLRELYLDCACVGGRQAILEAMGRGEVPAEALIDAIESLPKDPAMARALQHALDTAKALH